MSITRIAESSGRTQASTASAVRSAQAGAPGRMLALATVGILVNFWAWAHRPTRSGP